MKLPIYLLPFLLIACQSPTTKPQDLPANDSSKQILSKEADTTLFAKSNTVVITSENRDTIRFGRQEFNEIVKYFPALYSDLPQPPDISYYQSGIFQEITDADGKKKTISFSSEAGQDEYFTLYAYFLKRKNNQREANARRSALIKIYDDLDSIFGALSYGGTYFGHMYARIPAYAEYSLYTYEGLKQYYTKDYLITEQKRIFLISLRQFITDQVKVDENISDEGARNKRQRALFDTVDEIDNLITDYFFLKSTQEFWHSIISNS